CLALEHLRQPLLQVADLCAVVLGRLTGNRGLAFLGLGGLWTPAHRPPLTTYESAGGTLGEPVSQGKGTANRNLSLPGGWMGGGGLWGGRVNLSIIRGCVWPFSYYPPT